MKKAQKFLIACAIAKKTTTTVAKKIGCSQSMLSLVISGKRTSKRIEIATDLFVKSQFNKMHFIDTPQRKMAA